jgi:hypothetical protein
LHQQFQLSVRPLAGYGMVAAANRWKVRRMNHPKMKCLLFSLLLLVVAACSGDDPVGSTVSVKGKVTVDGKPATHGGVSFWPDTAKGNTSKYECSGAIAEDGTYTLYTRKKPGAPLGAYKVTVNIQTKADSTDPTKAKLELPKKYTSKETTPLTVEVVASPAAGAYDLDIK